MQLISVNIGQERSLQSGKKQETTGIFKLPTSAAIEVGPLGLKNDFICDAKNHGGPDQAVYIYGTADYAWWAAELGRELPPGIFGENLTISGLESASFSVGDRLHFDQVILEVTAPRIPCATLAARMDDPGFVKRYRQAVRPGLYCRVIQVGLMRVGESLRVEPYTGERLTMSEMFNDHYIKEKDEATLRRYLRLPIAIRDREELEQDLQELLHKL
jgi:MOSC domain-containing protein YiiM